MDRNPDLLGIYEWVLSAQEDLKELESAFPSSLRAEKQRVILSLRFLRVSLEVRIQNSFPKRAADAPIVSGPQDPPPRLSIFDSGGPD